MPQEARACCSLAGLMVAAGLAAAALSVSLSVCTERGIQGEATRTYAYAVLQGAQEVGVGELDGLEAIAALQGLHPTTGLALCTCKNTADAFRCTPWL
jgi:hypothetical protein